jgi:Bifunctional DNA primase/polymerase, N-terminal/Primase C terminal 1 (PriCT-1)
MIRTAITLAAKGMHVFPCWPGTKKPRTAHGCKDATTDIFTITNWWTSEPELNLAVATGAASGIFVVDVDGIDAEAELRRLESEHGALPPTVESITARGRHVWFRHPGPSIKNSASVVAPKIDIRGDGGFIVTPPSLHPCGRRYAWSVDSAKKIADAPDWLLTKITKRDTQKINGATPPTEWRELISAGVDEGARDCSAAKLAGHLLRRFIDPFVVLELIKAWNSTRCRPPLAESDIERIVASIATREIERRKLFGHA